MMFKNKLLVFIILVSSVVSASDVVLHESFESDLTGWSGLRTDGWEFTDLVVKEGQRAIANFDKYDSGLLKPIGTINLPSYECWFYDEVTSIAETLCVVTTGEISSQNMLLIGTETQLSKNNYAFFLSPDVNSWGVSTMPRTKGWHQARFVKTSQKTELYLDGKKIAETSNNYGWNKVGILLNNWYSSSGHEPAIFDSLKVYSSDVSSTTEQEVTNEQTYYQEVISSNDELPGNCVAEFIGESYCKGDSVYRAYKLDSCDISEKIVTRCTGSENCIDGQCVKICQSSNECSPGSRSCEGNAYKICVSGSDGCFKWSAKTDCQSEEVCLDGSCNPRQDEFIQTNAPSIQLKKTNEGIPGKKSAEIIFDVVNVDLGNSLEGFLLCLSPDDATISSSMGAGSGSGAQYVSPKFTIDEGPSQKSITLTLDSDTEGDKKAGCIIKYAFFKEQEIDSGKIRKYIKSDGSFTTSVQDSLFKEIRLDKVVSFENEKINKGNIFSRFFKWLSDIFGGE